MAINFFHQEVSINLNFSKIYKDIIYGFITKYKFKK